MAAGGKGAGRRRSPIPRSPSRPRGWVAGPPLQPAGAENAPGTEHPAPRRSAAPPRRLRAPPRAPPASPRRGDSPSAGTGSRPRRLLPLRPWLPRRRRCPSLRRLRFPRQPLGVRGSLLRSPRRLLLLSLLLLGLLALLGSAELIPDHIGSWASTPLHCRAPAPAGQPAYPLPSSPGQVRRGRRPRGERSAGRAGRAGRRGNPGGDGGPPLPAQRRAAHSAEAHTSWRPEGATYPALIHKQRPVAWLQRTKTEHQASGVAHFALP